MPNLTVPAPVGSGTCTGAIQAAIDAVHRAGGGRVSLAAGVRYRSGTINLRSRIELHLEMGAELVASADPAAPTQEIAVQLYFADYRPVDGILFPFQIVKAVNGVPVDEWKLEKFKLNPDLKAKLFEKKK